MKMTGLRITVRLALTFTLGLASLILLLANVSEGQCGESEESANVVSPSPLELTISLDKKEYIVEDPITLELHLKNSSLYTLRLEPVWHGTLSFKHRHRTTGRVGSFGFRLLDFGGHPVKGDIITLVPGETYMKRTTLHKKAYWMPLVPGDYELWVTYRNQHENWDDIRLWTGEISSNRVVFTLKEES